MSRDPIGYAAGDANLYGYVGGRPTGLTDPAGLLTWVDDTNQVFGLHQRICVNLRNSDCEIVDQKCYTFAHDLSKPGSVGKVYPDYGPPEEPSDGLDYPRCGEDYVDTNCEEDRKTKEWLDKAVGDTGPYGALTSSCRTWCDIQKNYISDKFDKPVITKPDDDWSWGQNVY